MCNPSLLRDVELGSVSIPDLPAEPLIKDRPNSSSAATNRSVPRQQSSTSRNRHTQDECKAMSEKPQTDAQTKSKASADTGLGSALLDGLPDTQQMVLLSFLMFLFFGMHNILQEAIVNLLGTVEIPSPVGHPATGTTSLKQNGTLMLGYAEVIGVLLFSYLERVKMTTEGGLSRVAPLRAYPLLTACLFASSSLSNMSLSYINFPTKVVFRSCKLVPTMIIATIVNARSFKSYEYLCAFSICSGLVLFAMADYTLDPLQFNPTGLCLVSASVVADAILPNAQEHLFKAGSSRLEVTVFSNLFSFIGMTVVILANGSLFQFIRGVSSNSTLGMYFAVYSVLSYISISCYMTLVKRFGGVTAVVLTTARKAMTLVLSFLLFPKGFSWLYVHGSLLVLGAVMLAGICKKLSAKRREREERKKGEYSLAYRNDDVESRRHSRAQVDMDDGSTSSTTSSSVSSGCSSSVDNSQLESSARAILDGIKKGAYV